jgi:hypothetical protein
MHSRHADHAAWGAAHAWYTHAFSITGDNTAVEAAPPKVRQFDWRQRLETFAKEDRAYVVLELPDLDDTARYRLTEAANASKGKFYDLGQLAIFMTLGRFHKDGVGTQVCSRVITAQHERALGKCLFSLPNVVNHPRMDDLLRGYATPSDLFFSDLAIVHFQPSTRFSTPPYLI